MAFTTIADRQRRSAIVWLTLAAVLGVAILVGVAILAVHLVRDDPTDTTPSTQPTREYTPATTAGRASAISPGEPVRLLPPARVVAGVGTGWPAGEVGGLSAAAAYATASTIDLDVLQRRLAVMYADSRAADRETAQILADVKRGRANLGVPPSGATGDAEVQLTPLAAAHKPDRPRRVEGYVLVRRQLVTYAGQRQPADMLPVPFVVKRVGEDWKLTADGVDWSPPPMPGSGAAATAGKGGWRELVEAR